MKKKLTRSAIALTLLVSALLVSGTAPVSATSICDVPATSFDIWLAQKFARC